MSRSAPVLAPFRAIRYSPRAGNLSCLLAPPYDVISPREQQRLYERDVHNVVRLELAQALPGDNEEDNRYRRAAAAFQEWLAAGILVRDPAPALYPVCHTFRLHGEEHRRLGVFAVVRLADWDEGLVLPHEDTFAGPKADRLQLLRAVGAQISPVFGLYRDPTGLAREVLEEAVAGPATAAAQVDSDRLELWRLDDAGAIAACINSIGQGPLFIADGHHRYETALAFRDEMRQAHPQAPARAGFNYVLMLLVAAEERDLVILPAARLLRHTDLAQVTQAAEPYFTIQPVALQPGEFGKALQDMHSQGKVAFIAAGREGTVLLTLRPHIPVPTDPRGALEVSQLHALLLDRLVPDSEEDGLGYEMGEEESCRLVAEGQYQVAVFLNAPTAAEVAAVALAGQRMPHKSTYFHPKPPTGLVMHGMTAQDVVG